MTVGRNATAEPLKEWDVMPACGSAGNVIASADEGFCMRRAICR